MTATPATPTQLHLEGWVDVGDVTPPDRRVWVVVAAAAIGTDLALRSGVTSLAGALLVAVVAGGALATNRITNRSAWPLFLAAPLFGVCLMTRSSPWLLPLDVLAAACLLVLGATLSTKGDPLELTVPGLVGRAVHALVHGTLAPAFLFGGVLRRRRAAKAAGTATAGDNAILRGALLAAPVVLVVGLLLRSADAVFASFLSFELPTDMGDVFVHAVMLAIGAWGAAGLLRLASAASFEMPIRRRWPLGHVEATTVLVALVGVFAAFAASQLVAVIGGASYVRRTAGLSYAEYARSGFFQLLGVAAISLAVLLAVRATVALADDASGARRRFLVLSEAAVVLTLLIVAVAVRRLFLYEQAYGLTMLRLTSLLVALWIGAVFVLLGLALAGVRLAGRRNWLAPGSIALALLGLLATNAANPEAIVVERNVDRFAGAAPGKLDVDYLTGKLTDDAVPALAAALDELRPEDAQHVRQALCAGRQRATGGLWAFNASADAAIEARQQVCRTR